MRHNTVPQELLDSVIYDETSISCLRYIRKTSKRTEINDVAGYPFNNKYYRLQYKGKTYAVHIIIWILHNGPVPLGFDVDHKDTNNQNNKISNLRLATHGQNQHNTNMNKSNPLGIKGLYKYPNSSKYIGSISFKGIAHTFRHEDINIVKDWLINKRKELHGKFSRD